MLDHKNNVSHAFSMSDIGFDTHPDNNQTGYIGGDTMIFFFFLYSGKPYKSLISEKKRTRVPNWHPSDYQT